MSEYHVMPWEKGTWRVRRTCAWRAAGILPTKREAIAAAKHWAFQPHGIVWIHHRDGTIERKIEQ